MSGWEHEVDEQTIAWLDLHAHEIDSVVKKSTRDVTGITYTVVAWAGLAQCTVWQLHMRFGLAPHLRPGGHNCEINARIQDDCANAIWQRSRDAVPQISREA